MFAGDVGFSRIWVDPDFRTLHRLGWGGGVAAINISAINLPSPGAMHSLFSTPHLVPRLQSSCSADICGGVGGVFNMTTPRVSGEDDSHKAGAIGCVSPSTGNQTVQTSNSKPRFNHACERYVAQDLLNSKQRGSSTRRGHYMSISSNQYVDVYSKDRHGFPLGVAQLRRCPRLV